MCSLTWSAKVALMAQTSPDATLIADLLATALSVRPHEVAAIREGGDHTVWRAASPPLTFFVKCGRRDAFDLEAWACREARTLGVPAPEVVAIEAEPDDFPVPYLILRELPGIPLLDQRVPREIRASGLRDAGQLLRKIHDLRLPGYGWADSDRFRSTASVEGREESWLEEVARGFHWGLEYIDEHRVLESRDVDVLRSGFANAQPFLTDFADGRFLHGDLQVNHILVDPAHGAVTGVLDWGDLQVGDPVWEIAILGAWVPSVVPLFLEGYEPDGNIRRRIEALLPFYRAYRHVWGYRLGESMGWDESVRLPLLREVVSEIAGGS